MPRVARFKIAAIEDLLRQLEYAPPETRRRQMEAAERLIVDVDPLRNYPIDFIVFRITGYRSDRSDEPVTLVGQALVPDLVNFVQTLSEDLSLRADELGGPALPIEEVAARLNVSQKTIQRYRKQGLVCKYLVFPDGVKRLACTVDALERFGTQHGAQLQKAAKFSRINGVVEADIINQARLLHESENLSLHEAAQRIAKQVGRSHETIRMLLRRHDRTAAQPIFTQRGPLTDREIILIYRAWQRGVESSRLTHRFGKSKATIHRAVNRRRRDLLRAVQVSFVQLPTFDLPDAEAVILSAPAVVKDLLVPELNDAMMIIDQARQPLTIAPDVEDALIAAYNFLKRRAAEGVPVLGEWPTSESLDAIETDLRWASALQRKLVWLALPAALRRIEQNLHRPLREQLGDEIVALIELSVHIACAAVETLDPTRGQRLERMVSMAMDKSLAKTVIPQMQGRAAVRHAIGSLPIEDPLEKICAWDGWLSLRRDLRRHVPRLQQSSRDLISFRYGLEGAPPLTIEAIALRMKVTQLKATRLLLRAIKELRAIARERK
jgi:RNA polymerase primary sigma factor